MILTDYDKGRSSITVAVAEALVTRLPEISIAMSIAVIVAPPAAKTIFLFLEDVDVIESIADWLVIKFAYILYVHSLVTITAVKPSKLISHVVHQKRVAAVPVRQKV